MQGIFLKFYVSEYREHKGILLFEWLLELAKRIGINGGTAMRAIAGFGRHGVLHEETFLELSADLPVEVSFVLSEEEAGCFSICCRRKTWTCFTSNSRSSTDFCQSDDNHRLAQVQT